jgi:LytS/YehU family sensor histidine kinase
MTNISYIKNKERRLNYCTILPYIINGFYFNVQNAISIEVNSNYDSVIHKYEYYFRRSRILNKLDTEMMKQVEWAKLINSYDTYFNIYEYL